MQENYERIEKIVITTTAIFCVIISLLDFIGVLDSLPWLSSRVPVMSLLAIGLFGLYLITSVPKHYDRLVEVIKKNSADILQKIAIDESSEQVISEVNALLNRRELDIQLFFDKAIEKATKGNIEDLTLFVKECRSNFLNGDVFGTRLFYPWDFNLGLLDFEGKCIYHDHQPLINTRLGQYFAWSEALKKKSGSLLWMNDMKSAKTWELFPDPEHKIRRITKFYFREISKLRVIVVFESHLNLLSDMPTLNLVNSSKSVENE